MNSIQELLFKYDITPKQISTDIEENKDNIISFIKTIVQRYYELNNCEELFKIYNFDNFTENQYKMKDISYVCVELPIKDTYIEALKFKNIYKTFYRFSTKNEALKLYYELRNTIENEMEITERSSDINNYRELIDYSKIFQNGERLIKIVKEYKLYHDFIDGVLKDILFSEKYYNYILPDQFVDRFMEEADKVDKVDDIDEKEYEWDEYNEVFNRNCIAVI